MSGIKSVTILLALMCLVWSTSCGSAKSIGLDSINIQGDLQKRILRNFDRLESPRFQPIEDVGCFREGKYSWPGDMEGRTILSLALLRQAVDRDAMYLAKILGALPDRLNDKGFFGDDFAPQCDEQQLSGHGWYLRGLCEYYIHTKDTRARRMIQDVVDNLVLPTRGKHKIYPIDPEKRKEEGGYSGTVVSDHGGWRLSSDIGCDFIFMDGVIQAAEVLGRKDLYPIIDEMTARFLEIDLVAIKAQTHATLTALRGLVRYANLTGRTDLIIESETRFKLYMTHASTENHMNYNWFGRPTHTEPCAIVDAFMVAVQLWQATEKTEYLEEAHRIYYNGICHAQRANGGFGLEDCGGSKDVFLKMQAPEAWWCCTMRGSEGLVKAAAYSYMENGKTLLLPFFNNASVRFNKGAFNVATDYPYNSMVTVEVSQKPEIGTAVSFFKPSWSETACVTLNGKAQEVTIQNGFVTFSGRLRAGDTLVYTFSQKPRCVPTHNINSIVGYEKIYYGPLLLAANVNKGREEQLPAQPDLLWDTEKRCAQVKGANLKLCPLTDVIDWNYQVNSYVRQILWKKQSL